MYSNKDFNYNYDLRAKLLDRAGNILEEFDAREVSAQNFDAGFAGGGIASGGQSYTIATNKDLSKYKKGAYSLQCVVEDTEYKVVNISTERQSLRGLGHYKSKREYVLYLN